MSATLFDTDRLQMTDAIRLTAESLRAYGQRYPDWVIAWSGGKDSTTVLTLTLWMLESGMVPAPESLTVLYADTRQELLPLWHCSAEIREELAERVVACQTVMAPMDRRMWVYILGRGVPPPNNNTLRYCTRQIKIEPMAERIREIRSARGRKVLVLTGVRQGESAVRDERIALSCSRNGAECGQGWFQETLPEDISDTLAPILHWRVCHVWRWLRDWAPQAQYGEWPTRLLADAYGGEEAEEANARTGCVCCPLASRDTALDAVIRLPHWAYLAGLKEIRTIYREMREPRYRLRKPGGEARRDGTLSKNQNRLGPITLESRAAFLERVLEIQAGVNDLARKQGRPLVDHLNDEEAARIRELIAARTWPDGWSGDEPTGDESYTQWFVDGSKQETLFSALDEE